MATRILILEDDERLRKLLGRVFASRGYVVSTAKCVAQFCKAATDLQYDACLLDLALPDGSGLDAWEAVRTAQPGAIAVIMTAHHTPEAAERAQRLGVRAILPKPLDLPMLFSSVTCARKSLGSH